MFLESLIQVCSPTQASLFIVMMLVNTLDSTAGGTVRICLSSDDVTGLPDNVAATFQFHKNSTTRLQLQRVSDLNLDIPIYTVDEEENIDIIRRMNNIDQEKEVGFYQDVKNQANIKITRERGGPMTIDGYFIQGGQKYSISPSNKVDSGTGFQQQLYNIELQHKEIHRSGVQDFFITTEQMLRVNFDPKLPLLRHSARHTRDVKPTYYIDVAAAVDYNLYQLFVSRTQDVNLVHRDIVNYFSFVFNGIDLLYKGTTWTSFNINVRLIKVVYFSSLQVFNVTLSSVRAGVVDAERTLDQLSIFLRTQLGKNLFVPYDHVMLFTGFPIANRIGTQLFGLAYKGEICSGNGFSISIISEEGSFVKITTSTHELGHSLSADHDGENNTCLTSDRYIMATSRSLQSEGNELHPWLFSSCTIERLDQHFAYLVRTSRGRMCLTGTLPRNPTYQMVGEYYRYLGQTYPPDKQCEKRHGKEYTFCRSDIGQSLCTQLLCCSDNSSVVLIEPAYAGTTCGSGKLCRQGRCVPDPVIPVLNEQCMFGDFDAALCSTFIAGYPGHCYEEKNFNSCCATCLSYSRHVQGCEYGDKASNCEAELCGRIENIWDCCGTCNYGTTYTNAAKTTAVVQPITTMTPTNTTASIDATCIDDPTIKLGGSPCLNFIWHIPSACYHPSIQSVCCATCSIAHTGILGCEFGDKSLDCLTDKNCTTLKYDCCESCRDPLCRDDLEFRMNGMTCFELIRETPNACYKEDVYKSCCATCFTVNSGVLGCEFGDKVKGKCKTINDCKDHNSDCCESCKDVTAAASISLSSISLKLIGVLLTTCVNILF